MFWKIKTNNFYRTALDSIILDTTETWTFDVVDKVVDWITLEDWAYTFWLAVQIDDASKKEIFRCTNVSGYTITYDLRISPNWKFIHYVWDIVSMNDFSEVINFLSDNTDSFGYTETVPWTWNELKVKVYWGRIIDSLWVDHSISDETITLSNNTTTYIYLDDSDFSFKTSASEPEKYMVICKVITASWDVSSIDDYRATLTGVWVLPVSLTEAERDALTWVRNGTVIFNTTSWVSNRYEWGAWYDYSSGSPVVRLSETVEWKARRSTDAEFDAWTDVGVDLAPLVAKPWQAKATPWNGISIWSLNEVSIDVTDNNIFVTTSSWASDEDKVPLLDVYWELSDTFIKWVFWDWSDWDVTISWTVTLNRDMYYNNLTIDSWNILNPNWYKVFVKWTLSWDWKIQRNGNDGWAGAAWAHPVWWTAWAALNQWTLNADLAWAAWWWEVAWADWPASSPSYHNVNWATGASWTWAYSSKAWGAAWAATRGSSYNLAMSFRDLVNFYFNPASVSSSLLFWPYKWIPWGSGGWANRTPNAWSSWWGWGSSWWVMWFCVNVCNFTWEREAIWWAWWDWGPDWWGGGSYWWWWWWGGWWILYLIYSTLTSLWTTTLTWWTWWTWWWWNNGSNWPDWVAIQIQI